MESTNPLWTRRTNSTKLSLSMSNSSTASASNHTNEPPSSKIFGPSSARIPSSSHNARAKNPFELQSINTSNIALPSPTAAAGTKSASSAFHLGGVGVFGNFGLKTPKTPGVNSGNNDGLNAAGQGLLGKGGLTVSEVVAGGKKPAPPPAPEPHHLKSTWVVWYRSPGNKFQDYEKSTHRVAHFSTVEEFWAVYSHLRRPSTLPHVSDYHLFKQGIRPVWEDKENRHGGKWNIRLKKGVANRYWEDLLFAIIGEQFGESGEDLCGAVLSVRGNEDVLSVWTRQDGPTCLKIKEVIKRKLGLPTGTRIDWKSHASSLEAVNNKAQLQQPPTPAPQDEQNTRGR